MKQEEIEKIINLLKKIPGISKKQANKMISFFLENSLSFTKNLFEEILNLQSKIKKCKQCLAYSYDEICSICANKFREKKLYVLPDYLDISKFESLDINKGKYFIFNEDINLKKIKEETNEKINHLLNLVIDFEEIILCLNTDINGQITMKYLEKQIRDKFPSKNVYQLSIGIPFGMSIDAIDPISLKQSILNKKKL